MSAIHLANKKYTACGKLVCGESFILRADTSELTSRRLIYGAGARANIQHTTIPDIVTCKHCKTTHIFKKKVDSDE